MLTTVSAGGSVAIAKFKVVMFKAVKYASEDSIVVR